MLVSLDSLLLCPVVMLSVVAHEWGHAWAATRRGDGTPSERGRLTWSPWPHLDPFGSLVLPALLLLFGAPFHAAWGKPVPIDPARLVDPRNDPARVALAGPMANMMLAILFALVTRLAPVSGFGAPLGAMAYAGVTWNCALAGLNLIPIPPLDGATILSRFLRLRHIVALHQLSPILLLVVALLLVSPWTSAWAYRVPLERTTAFILSVFGRPR